MLADILCSYAEIGLKDDTLLQAAAQVCSSIELNNWGLGLIDASDECVCCSNAVAAAEYGRCAGS